MKKHGLILLGFLLTGCPGGSSGNGYIALQVENSRAPAGIEAGESQGLELKGQEGSDPLAVTDFMVTITGEGIEPPIVANAEASATQIAIQGIPVGDDRTILIEAFNGEGAVIRRRELTGIRIKGGVTTPIRTSLLTIPVILNLRDGSVVLARNLHVIGFGEPGSSILVEAATAEGSMSFNENLPPEEALVMPSLSSGLFEFRPTGHLTGRQRITVTDDETGESSSITVVVLGDGRPGWGMVSAGSADGAASAGIPPAGGRTAHLPLVLRGMGGKPVGGETE